MRYLAPGLGALLVLSLLATTGAAAGGAPTAPTTGAEVAAAPEVAADELHVRTTFSLENVGDDEIRVVKEYTPGSSVDAIERTVPASVRDVSTRNMEHSSSGSETTFRWDGTGETARAEFVVDAAALAGPIGADDGPGQARRGDGFAVVEANYQRLRSDASAYRTAVEVNGEGAAGDNVAVLGPHETYSRESPSGEIRLVVPAHANLTSTPDEVLAAIAVTDRQIDAGVDRPGTNTYIAVESDLGTVSGLATAIPAGEGSRSGDVLVEARITVDYAIWQHEAVHQLKQSYRTTEATRWTTEGNAEYYGILLAWQAGHISFDLFQDWLAAPHHDDTRLDDPETWRGDEQLLSQYRKGALVTAHLDAAIRQATDGRRSYEDVLRRLNDHDGELTHEAFVDIVVAVGGQSLEPVVERYTTTEAAPAPPSNPYAFADPSIDSDTRLRKGSGLFSSQVYPGSVIYVTLEFENEGNETSRVIGLNSTMPEGWEIVSVRKRGGDLGPAEHADYGYFELAPGENRSYRVAARLPANASIGNHTLQFTAKDLSGRESTMNATIEVVPEGSKEDQGTEETQEPPAGPPPSAIEMEFASVIGTVPTDAANGSIPVFPPGESVNGSVSIARDNATIDGLEVYLNGSRKASIDGDEPPRFVLRPDPGIWNLTVETEFANSTSTYKSQLFLINDKPSVDLRGTGLREAGETQELYAEVENEYGSVEIVWYLNGERVATGETYNHTYREQADNVTVVVHDEYGETDRESRQFRGTTGLETILPSGTDVQAVKITIGLVLGSLVLLGGLLYRRW